MPYLRGEISQLTEWVTWGSLQLEYAFFIFMFIVLVVLAFKRAWILLFSTIIFLAFFSIFVIDPTVLIRFAEWIHFKLTN